MVSQVTNGQLRGIVFLFQTKILVLMTMERNIRLIYVLLVGIAGLFSACQSARISRYYAHNGYLSLYDNVVYNDSLSLFMPSFGDVTFERNAVKLSRLIRRIPLAPGDSVVLWGSTAAPPFYSFVFTVSDICTDDRGATANSIFHRDTCVNGQR